MRTYRIAAVLFLLLAIPTRGRAELPAPEARQLARTVDAALAGAAQAAQGPKGKLDPRNPKYAPFWSSLQAMRARVSRIEGSLEKPGNDFFLLVDEGSSDLGELRVAWVRTGAKNEQVAEQLRIAATSYRLLRSRFGREGVRLRQGGGLNGAEKAQLQHLQRSERRFAANLQVLRDQARRRRDAATAAEMERFRAEAEQIAQASADLASYLNALTAVSEMRGEWQADAPYVRKTAPPPAVMAETEDTVQDLYVDSDIGQVFTVDLGSSESAPAGPEAVQTFQPGEVQPAAVVTMAPADDPAPEDTEAADPDGDEAVETSEAAPAEEAEAPPAPAETKAKPAETKKSDPPPAPAPIPPPIG